MQEADDDTLFMDGGDLPTLVDVVIAGDRLREIGYRLPLHRTRVVLDEPVAEGLGERVLEDRLRIGLKRHLPALLAHAARHALAPPTAVAGT
jgi:hypothetical protein